MYNPNKPHVPVGFKLLAGRGHKRANGDSSEGEFISYSAISIVSPLKKHELKFVGNPDDPDNWCFVMTLSGNGFYLHVPMDKITNVWDNI